MDSSRDVRTASALTKLLRDELREARFVVTYLAGADARFVPRVDGGSTVTTLELKSEEEFDTDGLRTWHDGGVWKRELFRSEIRMRALPGDPESAASRVGFERLLEDLGVLSDGHVAHALGPLLPGPTITTVRGHSPDETMGIANTADLWNYLLVDACFNTPRRTATKVFRWACGAKLAFETRVLLGRLRVAGSFALANGLAVGRLPLTSDDLDDWLPSSLGIIPSEYLDRTILRIPCTIAPVLAKPTKVTDQRDGVPSVSWRIGAKIQSTWQLPLGGVRELTRALSLICNVAVETPMIWEDYGDHAHCYQRHGGSFTGTGELPPRRETEAPLTPQDLKTAVHLQPELCNPPADVQTALRYWLKSKARRADFEDRLVFLRTALEALFLDKGFQGELTYRLATNGAWYTSANAVERRKRFDLLKKVYAAASGAVHSGSVKKREEGLLKDGQEICRQAIMKRLRSKQQPVWRDIVFGR